MDTGTAYERRIDVSRPIRLGAGRRYAVEALMKDGGGGDCLGVTRRLATVPPPSDGDPPITGENLVPPVD